MDPPPILSDAFLLVGQDQKCHINARMFSELLQALLNCHVESLEFARAENSREPCCQSEVQVATRGRHDIAAHLIHPIKLPSRVEGSGSSSELTDRHPVEQNVRCFILI